MIGCYWSVGSSLILISVTLELFSNKIDILNLIACSFEQTILRLILVAFKRILVADFINR